MTNLTIEIIWLVVAFLLGSCVGSFINVVVGRLPYEKSLLWPSSTCLKCYTPLRLMDNLPVIGYLMLGGKCRYCGSRYSSQYLWIELICGAVFAGLLYFDIFMNGLHLPVIATSDWSINQGLIPWQGIILFFHHAILFSFLLAAALSDIHTRTIPLSLTATGTIIGLISATIFAWPFPTELTSGDLAVRTSWAFNFPPEKFPRGVYQWPVWGPLPTWLMVESRWLLGLLTGLAGAAMGSLLVRAIKFLVEKGMGREAIGMGDADLMMMAGAFIGWQGVIVSFFVGGLCALPMAILMLIFKKDRSLPFGPGLALGVVIVVLNWPRMAPALQSLFFDEIILLVFATIVFGGMFIGGLLLRFTNPAPQGVSSS